MAGKYHCRRQPPAVYTIPSHVMTCPLEATALGNIATYIGGCGRTIWYFPYFSLTGRKPPLSDTPMYPEPLFSAGDVPLNETRHLPNARVMSKMDERTTGARFTIHGNGSVKMKTLPLARC
ncbi:hypothetical protein DQ04_21111000 [Trypanosoma grayi]|uniref:hypothetical protein n=1 Tax=Trypanosoma grayi TaxID=71804 RepID=UPI0004F46FB2|nr:hypothetical protein DQ04_21111000 [Trypanosoma grayi]KEG05513.1 hypothetical protein DQ04_21111000 [Trypanosoma grayi]